MIWISWIDSNSNEAFRWRKQLTSKMILSSKQSAKILCWKSKEMAKLCLKAVWRYSKSCLIQNLWNPFPCFIQCWFSFLAIWHHVRHKISLPVHIRLDRFHCMIKHLVKTRFRNSQCFTWSGRRDCGNYACWPETRCWTTAPSCN